MDGIKSLVTLKPKAQTVFNSIVTPKGVISSNCDIAEEFNNFFSSVGSKISSKIPECKNNFKYFVGDKVMNSFFLRYTDKDEILKIIKNLKSNKWKQLNYVIGCAQEGRRNHVASGLTYNSQIWKNIFHFKFT